MTYDEFIQDIISKRGQFGIPEGEYKERHHIVPKCLGGSNEKDNLIVVRNIDGTEIKYPVICEGIGSGKR